jgi:hypothetical protein
MSKRSIFLALAVGALANLTFVTSSEAGSVVVVNSMLNDLSGLGITQTDTIDTLTVTFSGIPTPPGISDLSISVPSDATATSSGDTVNITFTPTDSSAFILLNQAFANFSFEVTGTGSGITAASAVFGTSKGNFDGRATVSVIIPEPNSMALGGIGMACLLAFHRLRKRFAAA